MTQSSSVWAHSIFNLTSAPGFNNQNITQYLTTSQWNSTLTTTDWNNGNTGLGIQVLSLSSNQVNAEFLCGTSPQPCYLVQMIIYYYFDVSITSISPNAYYGP